MTSPTRSERLDRLPFNSEHRRLLVGSGIGWALDAMDVGLISFIMAALASSWSLSNTELSWIGSIGFLGMAIGASLGGLLADRIGRRQVFALTLLVYGIATGASALATSVAMLIILRFIVGLGLGAELPVASTLVSEFAPRKVRGRVVVALEAFWALGWILAATIGYLVIPASENGWRWALALGVVPAAYALVVRYRLPESVRFLQSKGKYREAELSVRQFEQASGITTEAPLPKDVSPEQARKDHAGTTAQAPTTSAKSIWAPSLARRTAALWIVWFCINLSYYGAFIWLPSLLFNDGFTLVKSFQYTLIITLAQLPGYAASAWLIEKWGRRATLASFLVGSAISAAFFGSAGSTTALIAAGCALSFFNLGAWGALYAITPEVYPTAVRATGAGAAAAFGRLASILAPLLVPVLLQVEQERGIDSSHPLVFGTFAAAFVVAAVAAFALPDKTNKALDA